MTFPTFSVGEVLRAQDMNAVGLWLVKTQTVGTGVSSVTVTGAFSADWDNYKIIYTDGVTSNPATISLQLGASTTGYYGSLNYNLYTASTPISSGVNNQSSAPVGVGTPSNNAVNVEVFLPFLAKTTGLASTYTQHTAGAGAGGNFAGFHNVASSYTSFTLSVIAGYTMTGGTIRVYGYRN